MSGEDIRQEVKDALVEAATETGDGELVGTFLRKPDPTGPSYAPVYGADLEYTASCIRSNFTVQERAANLVGESELLFLVEAEDLTITPSTTDRFKVDGVTYQVKAVDPVSPGGVVLMWKVRVAK